MEEASAPLTSTPEPTASALALLERAGQLLSALERRLDPSTRCSEPSDALAYRFRTGRLSPIEHPDLYPLAGLLGVDESLRKLRANAEAFCSGSPALDMLLYGERGTGKSSALRGLLAELAPRGLRLVETEAQDLVDLSVLFALLRPRMERFIVCCDDLSFEHEDAAVRRLKAVLDGGLERRPDNVLIAVTSNRRHLLVERQEDNRHAFRDASGELHLGETVHEKISLSDRFGLSLPFWGFPQETYLEIVRHHARQLGLLGKVSEDALHSHALRFALQRGGRSGRTARQACIALLQDLPIQAPRP